MNTHWRLLLVVPVGLLIVWLAFVGIRHAQLRSEHYQIASELRMEKRTFYTLPDPISSPCEVEGEERRLVVGVSEDNYLLCSIVRNTLVSDTRSKWMVDMCFRPDLQPNHPRLPIWKPIDHFPNDSDLELFRLEALAQPWVCWDRPNGTDPKPSDNNAMHDESNVLPRSK